MATIVLSAVGAAAGAHIGGGILGLSSVVLGRAIGASVGRAIDHRLLGGGSAPVETGRVERFRVTGASEGGAVTQVYGRMRVGGQVIWASRFEEHSRRTGGGGKGAPRQPSVTQLSYTVSLAVALCEGEISRVGRIWADGVELAPGELALRVYTGSADQMPDPRIEAVEGAGQVPAYRGTAYVVIEDLDLGRFGNRVPQFTFEVMRPSQAENPTDLTHMVRAVALIPGTGEYALATTPVHLDRGLGRVEAANISTPGGRTDFALSLEALETELPECGSVSLVVSWFGDDLRAGTCRIVPKVEQTEVDGQGMAWRVSGVSRAQAEAVPRDAEDRAVYGGTPADAAVIEAIAALQAAGREVVFYPFILMDQMAGNARPDPWTGGEAQPALPWRGRITTSLAPGLPGSPDGTAAADAEVAAFFGAAQPGDFTVTAQGVDYTGPAEFSFRRMILHYAHLCAAAGGVSAFCIGSEMRALTRIRGASGFPAVAALAALAADVRAILGPGCKIGYAADWTEYAGYQRAGDLFFPLDPLWADANIDFVGIDNYMPLSDWRAGEDHADAGHGSIYDLDYLKGNIEGGEGYDWFYAHPAHRDAQIRTPITDGAHDEPWVWRVKDIRNWWAQAHHERIGGVRQPTPTPWVPQSKPVWFTELGCAAIDKGTNQPNKFLDPKSSESALPYYSDGRRDDFIQHQYLRAMHDHWGAPGNNPVSEVYGGPMIDMSRAHVWAWDARPYPAFPQARELWSDGANYARGHWLNGRSAARPLADVVAEICARSGVDAVDTSRLWGLVRGYTVGDIAGGRAALQPLMLAHGFDAVERGGQLVFASRDGRAVSDLAPEALAWTAEQDSPVELTRAPEAEMVGRVRQGFVEADGDYTVRSEEAILPDETARAVSSSEFPMALTRAEGRAITERWLAEARVARDAARFALPPSCLEIGAGDVVRLSGPEGAALYRIDHVTQGGAQLVEAVRVEPGVYAPADARDDYATPRPFVPPLPVHATFLDLPLLTGEEVPHAPHVAVTATPWPGSAALYASASDDGYALDTLVEARAVIGVTQTVLEPARPGIWDRGRALRLRLAAGALAAASPQEVLNGANLAAIGDGDAWEVFQFAEATLVGPDTYELSLRLRGQAGTDGLGATWPAGSQFVLLDGTPGQIGLAQSARGLARHYRIGPAGRPYDDPSYRHEIRAFDGVGLRPYAPAHLRAQRLADGALALSWVRRTRIDGDSWQAYEVPLGETAEIYLLRVVQNGSIHREVTLSAPAWTYGAAAQAADGLTGPYSIEVAQVSDAFGPGLFRRIEING